MAQQDFVNKKRPAKKQKVEQKPFPKVLFLFALLLIGGFVYGLWYISSNSDSQTQPKKSAEKKPDSNRQTAKPVPKEPDFIPLIKEREVQVEVHELESKGPYAMQCGSFRTYEQAEQLKARIAFSGLHSEIRRTEGKNGVWFKVRLGPYEKKRQAESARNQLKRQKIMSCQIWNWS